MGTEDMDVTARTTGASPAAAGKSREVDELARELWWPHHKSRTRDIALAELDDGSPGEVKLEYADVVAIVEDVIRWTLNEPRGLSAAEGASPEGVNNTIAESGDNKGE